MMRIQVPLMLVLSLMAMSSADLLGGLEAPLSIVDTVTDILPIGDPLETVSSVTDDLTSVSGVLDLASDVTEAVPVEVPLKIVGGVVDKLPLGKTGDVVSTVTKLDPKTLIRTLKLLALLGGL